MTEDRVWKAGTWEGSRRAVLDRALQRTVRERLEIMESLSATAGQLFRLGQAARGEARRPPPRSSRNSST